MANQSKLKAWVRYDGTGRVVTGGPIVQLHKPKVGNWKQINLDLCCNGPIRTTTTTTTARSGGGGAPTAWLVTSYLNQPNACANISCSTGRIAYTGVSTLTIGTTIWANAALTIPFNLDCSFVKFLGNNTIYTLSANATTLINGVVTC